MSLKSWRKKNTNLKSRPESRDENHEDDVNEEDE